MARMLRIAPANVERCDMKRKDHTSDINSMKIADSKIEIGLDHVKEIFAEETHIEVEAGHRMEIEDLEAFRDIEITGKEREAIVLTQGDIIVTAVAAVADLIVIVVTVEAELQGKQA
jgi:hypothetical protein